MIPVDQTTFGIPEGNCFSACVASLLHLSIEEVPYFMEGWNNQWFDRFVTWLAPFGFYPIALKHDSPQIRGLYIMGGQSPRGSHSVVARAGTMVHDPHPSRAGLTTIEDAILLVPFDPSPNPDWRLSRSRP